MYSSKIASSRVELFPIFTPDRFAPDKFAPDKFAPDKFAPANNAFLKSAPERSALVRKVNELLKTLIN